VLELSIMGIFVLIAQPQLRQGIIELVYPPDALPAAPPVAGSTLQSSARLTEESSARLTEASASQIASHAALRLDALRLDALPGTLAAHAPQSLVAAGNNGWSMRTASYAPLEKFESFTLSLPDAGRTAARVAAAHAGQQRVAGYAPNAAATQLTASDWTIASAAQSPRPLSGWTSSRPADAVYRDSYPPPFGTQSQWK
jgi:hypothetical protein